MILIFYLFLDLKEHDKPSGIYNNNNIIIFFFKY